MSTQKEPPDKTSSEENPFFYNWPTFEWEKITDNMRRAIEITARTSPSKTSSHLGLESSQSNSSAIDNISALREGRYFNPSEILNEMTSPPDHPSQLVDALKVGLADILLGSKLEEQDASDDEEFSKSLDVSYDNVSRTDLFGADNATPISRVVGSSESDDSVTDISTTESRESIYVEKSTDIAKVQPTALYNTDLQTQPQQEQVHSQSTTKEQADSESNDNLNADDESKNDIPLVSNEPIEVSCGDSDVVEQHTEQHNSHTSVDDQDGNKTVIEREDVSKQLFTAETVVSEKQDESVEVSGVEDDDDAENWRRDITVEDMLHVEDANNVDVIDDSELETLSEEYTDHLQNSNAPESHKKSYADVLKKGLKPDVITLVRPLTFSLCCQKEKQRAANDAKRKSPKKTPNKDKKSRRSSSNTRRGSVSESPSCHGSRATPDKIKSPTPSRSSAKPSPGKDTKRDSSKSPSRKSSSRRKISFDKCDYWDAEVLPSESSISDDASAEELLREKIKAEQIAKVLQEAKLTLAKLTTESLGSYEKVSCLKQVPSANNDAFELLQSQEINKSKHMKELANHLHELTQMGLGNAKEFSEIKDILISLHYLQTKDKYFIEKNKEKTVEKTVEKAVEKTTKPSKRNQKDSGVSFFWIIFLILGIFIFIFKKQWFIIICAGVFIAFCIFGPQQQKCTKKDKTCRHSKKHNK